MVFHKGDFPKEWSLIKVVCDEGGLSLQVPVTQAKLCVTTVAVCLRPGSVTVTMTVETFLMKGTAVSCTLFIYLFNIFYLGGSNSLDVFFLRPLGFYSTNI